MCGPKDSEPPELYTNNIEATNSKMDTDQIILSPSKLNIQLNF